MPLPIVITPRMVPNWGPAKRSAVLAVIAGPRAPWVRPKKHACSHQPPLVGTGNRQHADHPDDRGIGRGLGVVRDGFAGAARESRAGNPDHDTKRGICGFQRIADAIGWEEIRDNRSTEIRILRDRLARGEKCFLAEVDGEIVHVNWSCFQWCEVVPGMPIVLEPGEVYTTDAFTVSRWRGKKIHEAVLNEMLRCAQRRACTRAYTVTYWDNKRPQRGLQRLGWKVSGKLIYILPRGLHKVIVVRISGDLEPLCRGLPARTTTAASTEPPPWRPRAVAELVTSSPRRRKTLPEPSTRRRRHGSSGSPRPGTLSRILRKLRR